jgi:hypothetical protein
MFRGPKLPKTRCKLIVGATTVVKRDITPTDALIHALMLISPLQLHLPLPVEPTLFLLLPSRTKPVGESITVVLFDSGALHAFIFATYVGKHNLPLALLKCQMIVSSPGGDMPARQLCPKVNLKTRG